MVAASLSKPPCVRLSVMAGSPSPASTTSSAVDKSASPRKICIPRIGDFPGGSKAFALQAGREIRILVQSEKIDDEEAVWLSKDIARRIENELESPGQIKVTVIRETRAVDYAR